MKSDPKGSSASADNYAIYVVAVKLKKQHTYTVHRLLLHCCKGACCCTKSPTPGDADDQHEKGVVLVVGG